MKRIRFALAALALSALLVAPLWVRAWRSDPEAVLRALAAALNAGDIEGALALFTEDAIWITPAGRVFPGKAQVREIIQEEVANHLQWFTIQNGEVTSDKVTALVTLAHDNFRQLGLESSEVLVEARVHNGQITALQGTLPPETVARLQAALAQVQAQQVLQTLPETGKTGFPNYTWVLALGGLGCFRLGVALRRRHVLGR